MIARVATGGDHAAAHTALSELYRVYWYPLYAFARRRGFSPEDAEDATQSFWLDILDSTFFASADPARGRLRTFLLTAFSRQLSDARRDASRLKRGGGIEFVPLDIATAEDRMQAAPQAPDETHQFEADWASALVESAIARVEADYTATNRAPVFNALRPYLCGGGDLPDQAALAAQLGMSHGALRQTLTRLRDRFRTALRAAIADTLHDPTGAAIDEELRALRAVLAG